MVLVTEHVVFDLDGTLTDQSRVFSLQAEAVADVFGVSEDRYQEIIDSFYLAHDFVVAHHPSHKGDISWYIMHMSRTLGLSISLEQAVELAAAWEAAHEKAMATQILYEDVLESLARLKSSGCTLYLASGNTNENRQLVLESVGLATHFSDVFAAATIGHQKQRLEFWEQVLSCLAVPASRVTVVGNQLNDDVLNPRALGMKTVLIKRPASLMRTEDVFDVSPDWIIESLQELVYAKQEK